LQKHGISFETACDREAFLDPFVQSIDVEEVDEELREAIIGMTISLKLLYVVYTIRNEEIFRLISERSVTKLNPGNKFHSLKGDRKGQYAISVNKQWRVCFEWHDGNAYNVEIIDYH